MKYVLVTRRSRKPLVTVYRNKATWVANMYWIGILSEKSSEVVRNIKMELNLIMDLSKTLQNFMEETIHFIKWMEHR